MIKKIPKILLLGADSEIGFQLYKLLTQKKFSVFATSKKNKC